MILPMARTSSGHCKSWRVECNIWYTVKGRIDTRYCQASTLTKMTSGLRPANNKHEADDDEDEDPLSNSKKLEIIDIRCDSPVKYRLRLRAIKSSDGPHGGTRTFAAV